MRPTLLLPFPESPEWYIAYRNAYSNRNWLYEMISIQLTVREWIAGIYFLSYFSSLAVWKKKKKKDHYVEWQFDCALFSSLYFLFALLSVIFPYYIWTQKSAAIWNSVANLVFMIKTTVSVRKWHYFIKDSCTMPFNGAFRVLSEA